MISDGLETTENKVISDNQEINVSIKKCKHDDFCQ